MGWGGGFRLLLLLAWRCLAAKRMQMSASHKGAHSCTQSAKDRGTRRPSLSSVTSDPLSMTCRVHTNMPHPQPHPHPCQRAVLLAATSPPSPPTTRFAHCPQMMLWLRDSLAGGFTAAASTSARMFFLPTQRANELRERANNLYVCVCVRFHSFSTGFPSWSLFGLCCADWDEGRRGGGAFPQKESGGKEPDCFNLSARGAPLFIKLSGRVIQTQAPVFCGPAIVLVMKINSLEDSP